MFQPDPALFAPEIRPAQDETPKRIEPNLALDEDLCKDVADYICQDFFVPYLMQAERMYRVWDEIDDMWRTTVKRADLDVGNIQMQEGMQLSNGQGGGFGMANKNNANQAKVSPAAAHKQIDAITNLGESLSFESGQIPVQAKVPKTTYENPLYNPNQQSADAANAELQRQAAEVDLKRNHRIGFGNFVKYGHAFAMMDFRKEFETIECRHVLSPDMNAANPQLAMLREKYGTAEAKIEQDAYGRNIAVFLQTVPKVLHTQFMPLDVSAVFVDELIPCRPMERQPCPIVRTHINRWELADNPYHPEGNPFGWLNIETALKDDTGQYALSQPDEAERRRRILKRWGMSGQAGAIDQRNTIKQLWTAFPLLAIDEATGKLDRGDGLTCPVCNGAGTNPVQALSGFGADGEELMADTGERQDCQNCGATGKVRIKAKRYVVQLFGSMYGGGGVTVLRIQRNPTPKDRIPIGYSSHLCEDTSTCRPVSKSEIALSAYQQLATAHNQFLDSKSLTIRRPWKKKLDSAAYNVDCNKPDSTIPIDVSMDEVERIETDSFDNTTTLVPYMQMMESEVQDIFGANDTVIGEISAGRRSANEIGLADEGSKRPLVQMIDQYNHDMFGRFGWGGFVLENLEAWQDRDWMVKRTGKTTWGKLDLFTAVGEEMMRKSAAIANYRYILEMSATNPALQPVVPYIIGEMLPAMGIIVPDGVIDQGFKKSQQEAFEVLTKILGDGVLIPPMYDDPDDLFIGVFENCMRAINLNPNNHWAKTVPQNVPLLQERIAMQKQQRAQKQMQAMQMQLMQAKMEQQALGEDPLGNQTERPGKPAKNGAQERQQQGS